MAHSHRRGPYAWDNIQRLLEEFGYLEVNATAPAIPLKRSAVLASLVEWHVSVMLQPKHLYEEFSKSLIVTDTEIREAMYSMAEDAISVAEEYFVFTEGPKIVIHGGNNQEYLEGRLTMVLMEKVRHQDEDYRRLYDL